MAKHTQRILVTGSSGMIGTRLCEVLQARGYRVVGFDRRPNKWSKEIQKVTVMGDLLDKKSLERVPGSFDCVVHLAANARVYKTVENPELARENMQTTYHVLEFARQRRVKNILFASSREVYGNGSPTPCGEDDVRLVKCESPYAASKIAGEAMVRSWQECYGIDFVILRFSNVYGMYDDSDRVVPRFLKAAFRDQDLVVFGKEKVLDFTYIDDCVEGIMQAIKNFKKAKNDVYNVAYGKGTSLVRVAEYIRKITGSKSKIRMEKSRPGEVARFVADISKAKRTLGYAPKVAIQEGLAKAMQWYQAIF